MHRPALAQPLPGERAWPRLLEDGDRQVPAAAQSYGELTPPRGWQLTLLTPVHERAHVVRQAEGCTHRLQLRVPYTALRRCACS